MEIRITEKEQDLFYKNNDSYLHRELMKAVYRKYQTSSLWVNLRKRLLEKNSKCQLCKKKKAVIVHHTIYDNWGKGDIIEEEDCIVVCRSCHNKEHRKADYVPFFAKRNDEIRHKFIEEAYFHEL